MIPQISYNPGYYKNSIAFGKNVNKQLLCILEKGKKSDCINDFIKVCHQISLNNFLRSRFRNELVLKTGCTERDLALDLIADLFEVRDGKYYHFNNYFDRNNLKVKKLSETDVIALLYPLIRSAINQRISELRESFGESYFKIKKAIDICITRNRGLFKKFIYKKKVYIHTCKIEELNFRKEPLSKDYILFELFGCSFRTCSIPEIMRKIFQIVNKKSLYLKALDCNDLSNIMTDFYRKRVNEENKSIQKFL